MAARITRMTDEAYLKIVEAWHKNSSRMCDPDKRLEVLDYRLFNDGQTQWYQGPGQSWMYISEIVPGGNANFHALNLDGQAAVQVEVVRLILKEMFVENDLRRMSIILPSPLVKIAHAAQQLGFKHEGRMRDAAMYGGRLVDAEIFGMTHIDIDDGKHKKRKRKRRSRRRKTAAKAKAKNGKD